MRRALTPLVLAAAALAFAAEAQSPTPPDVAPGEPFAVAAVIDASGSHLGDVEFVERDDGSILITADLTGLPPGFHGFNLHDHLVCDLGPAPLWGEYHSDFEATQHPDHAGDFPPLLVNADGSAFLSFVTDRLTVQKILFPGEGSSVVVHAAPDNFANIPPRYAEAPDDETLTWGDSGADIACGGVELVTPSS